MLSARRAAFVLVVAIPFTGHAAAGDLSTPIVLATSVWSYSYPQNGQPGRTTTISDRFSLVEAIGLTYAATDRLRLTIYFQFSQAITNPPPTSSFTGFSIGAPSLGYNFWGPLTVSVNPNFILRRNGMNDFAFGVNAQLSASVPLGAGVAFLLGLSVQNVLTPVTSTTLFPYAGFSFKLGSLAEPD
jgi:hypothetical protein